MEIMPNFSAGGGSASGGKNKNELTFFGIGILMVIIVVSMLVWPISFLTKNISGAFDKQDSASNAVISFQADRAEVVLTR